MKPITAIALLTIASFVPLGSALAADQAVEAKVPFDFTVGNQLLPAGTYRISSASSGMLEIRDSSGQPWVKTAALQAHSDAIGRGDLVFDRYGDKYFLSEIICPSAAISAHIPASKLEKQARTHEASLHSSGQTLVAVK